MTDATTTRENHHSALWRRIWNCRVLYLLILPLIVWYVMFCYVPMAGLYLAFERFSYKGGIWGSAWVGLNNFYEFFSDGEFLRALRNTVIFSLGKLALQFPTAIILALALNELRHARIKKLYQTVFTFPHFISWVVMAGILKNMFASNGVINQLLTVWGMDAISPLLSKTGFRPFIWFSNIWKEAGWDTIIYMAALAGIDPGLYEAAEIDGANRLRQTWHITLPGIMPTIIIMLILRFGSLMSVGHEKVYAMQTDLNLNVSEVISTFTYKQGILDLKYDYATAVDLFNSLINILMLTTVNAISKKVSETSLW